MAVAFIEADSLENIDALGWRTIKRWQNNLTPAEFNIAIMNKDNIKMDGGFYPNLSFEHHGYDAETTSAPTSLTSISRQLITTPA